MILPDDLDEKAEIRVGETDTEDEYDEDEYRPYGSEEKSKPWGVRPRQKLKRYRGRRRVDEKKQLGNGLQLSLGRKDEDVFILKQELKIVGTGSVPRHSGRPSRPGSSQKSSPPKRHTGFVYHSATVLENSNSQRSTPHPIHPRGLGLNIWPNHAIFSRGAAPQATDHDRPAVPATDTALRIRDNSDAERAGTEELQTNSPSKSGSEKQALDSVESIDVEGPNDRTKVRGDRKGIIEVVWNWAWPRR